METPIVVFSTAVAGGGGTTAVAAALCSLRGYVVGSLRHHSHSANLDWLRIVQSHDCAQRRHSNTRAHPRQ